MDVLPEDRVRIDPELWGRMAGFVERRENIHARYQTFDGRESTYSLQPYHLLAYHGNWYLLAHNEEKVRMATFALSRFRQVEGTGATFQRVQDFDARAYAREAFGITSGENLMRVRLLFEPKLAVYLMERDWHPSQTFTRRPDGRVEMRLETSGRQEHKGCGWGRVDREPCRRPMSSPGRNGAEPWRVELWVVRVLGVLSDGVPAFFGDMGVEDRHVELGNLHQPFLKHLVVVYP